MHSRATDRRSASKGQGKWPDQTLGQAFGLPEVLVAVSTSRLSCKRAGKTRTLMPVWDSSGESRIITGGTGKYKGITGSEPFACITMPALAGPGGYAAMDIPHNTTWEIKFEYNFDSLLRCRDGKSNRWTEVSSSILDHD